jgi:UDP-N-acetylmuramoyl-tripeptide--D-alanyl-D-alanine ligase
MRALRMSEVARAVGGTTLGGDVEVRSVTTDSRDVEPGALFVALPGDRDDGHRFVGRSLELGAVGAMVLEGYEAEAPTIHVRSTYEALLRLAAYERRRRSDLTVVAVTGANGKTSTKDMAGAICAATHRTHVSPGSFNNEVGLPRTLLGAPDDAGVVIAEMGARRRGDVALLCEIARPDIVVVTNVGVAHLEIFGSWEAIVEASAEPVDWLDDDGIGILNGDDPVVRAYASRCRGKVVTFGLSPEAQVRAEAVALGRDGLAAFDLVHEGDRERIRLAVPGDHMVPNALAAAAVGLQLGVPFAACASGLAHAAVSRWRMESFTTPDGVRVVNDAYNANPESMAAALRTARWMAGDGRLIAVLGGMAELGPITAEEHERVGELAARIRVDRLIAVGPEARSIAVSAVREGIEPDDVTTYDDIEDVVADVRAHAAPGDVLLCKASRIEGLERVAEALR